MSEYQTLSHAKVSLKYHMIFSTKYRRKILNPIRESVLSAFKEVENRSDGIKILCMELDKDHIHLLIRFKPRYSIEQVVRRLKQVTTYLIWLENEEYLKKYYWSGKHMLWTNGYFCSTIGDVSEKTLTEYIQNQG